VWCLGSRECDCGQGISSVRGDTGRESQWVSGETVRRRLDEEVDGSRGCCGDGLCCLFLG